MDDRAPGGRLLEREQELASLASLVEDAAGGEARVALIEGAPGIGKTQLVAETRRCAEEAGLRVFRARGSELEREFPFGIVRQLLEPALVDPAARSGLLAGAAAAAATVFEPGGDDGGEPTGDASFAVLHGLYWLVVNLSAQQPLLLAIDDLQWTDRPSLRFLAYLVRRLEGLPVLAVCSLRPSEPGLDAALYGEIVSDPLAHPVRPRPLSEKAVAELVVARLGAGADPAFSAACHDTTGGNPLLLNELLKALASESVAPDAAGVEMVAELGPRAASRAVLLRLGRLSVEAVAAARGVAVLGEGVDLPTLAALAGLGEPETAAATAALVRAEILRPEPPVGFVHALVGAAVYHDIPPGERELAHERAARLLAAAGAAPERVAGQLLAVPARGDAWVVDTLRSAAHSASQKGAAENAVALLSRALEEPPSAEARSHLLLELGLAEALTHGPAAAQHLREAYESISDPALRGSVARMLGLTLLQTGERDEAAEVVRRAAAELPPELADLRRALEAFELATVLFGVGEQEELRRLEAFRTDRGEGAGTKMCAGLASYQWALAGGTAGDCARLALHALSGGELIAADPGFLSIGPIIVLTMADRDEALEAWDALLADAHRSGSLYTISTIHLWRGLTFYRRGDLEGAQEELEAAFEEFQSWGYGTLANIYCSGLLGLVLLERGDIAGARRTVARGSDPGLAADGIRYWLHTRLELLVAERRASEALEIADTIAARFPSVSNPAAGPQRSLKAQALDRLGRHDEARACARDGLELARLWGAPWAVGRALRVLGTLEREEGLAHLREAVETLHGSSARLEHAKALAALGAALRRAREPAGAREPLREALELAAACGADGLVEEVRAELAAAGARPRTTAMHGIAALTPSESRVATLAAGGQTNRDIAQTLFVTPKTVEVHLSSAYRKLGIQSRRELAAALAAT